MKNLILQIDSATLSGATPFSTAIYSVMVAILIAAIVWLAKQWSDSRKENKELTEKTLLLIGEIKEKVLGHVELIKDVSEIKRLTQDIQKYIEKHEK